jgi:biopolymer transport protein ExbD
MKFRRVGKGSEAKIELQMTPMIDVVFQLLVFFLFTFRIATQEGDFNIKMPLSTYSPSVTINQDSPVFTLHVRLRADADGRLPGSGGIVVNNERSFDSFEQLHNYVISIIGGHEPGGNAEAEVELDCDYNLHYEHVIDAITAVSGYVDRSTGQIERLIERINFASPQAAGGGR